MSIGDNIKKWRELRNLKQSELAEVLGVSDKTVSSWEINRTEPKMGMVEKICKALNCQKTDIVGADSEVKNVQPDIVISFPDGSQVLVEMKRATLFQEKCLTKLLKYYSLLNEIGQKKALDNIEDLAKIYAEKKTMQPPSMVAEKPTLYGSSDNVQNNIVIMRKSVVASDNAHLIPDAAHDRTDISKDERTDELIQQEDDIMDDPNF